MANDSRPPVSVPPSGAELIAAERQRQAPPSPQPPLCGLCFVNPATSHLTFSGSVAGQEYDDTVSVCEACTEGWLGSPVSGADQ